MSPGEWDRMNINILPETNNLCPSRLHYIKKLTKRQQKDVVLLKSRLDLYNDSWRTAHPNTKVRRVPKKPKLPSKSSSGPNPVPAMNPLPSNLRANSNGGAAPIPKLKRSSQTGTGKRQSANSRTIPELWKSNTTYPMDD